MNNQQKGPRRATTIVEYLEHVEEIKEQWSYPVLVFRGQKNEEWPLDSAAERRVKKNANSEVDIDNKTFIEYHQDLIKKCKLKNYDKREGKQLEELEILADLRHHGGAVCLIDFTRNALVALWFACEDSDTDGNVFVVNTADEKTFLEIAPTDIKKSIEAILHFKTRGDKDQKAGSREQRTFRPLSQDKPNFWYWTPAHLNERITAQHSLFVFGVPSSNEPSYEKIIIESENKDQIRQDLKEVHDIHEESLFPDFGGFAYTHRIDAPYEILDAEEYVRRGLEAQQQGESEQAIQYYNKAIELNPSSADAYNSRGIAYAKKDELERAIQNFGKAIELNPSSADAYNNRGNVYSDKGELDRAIQDYNKALELNPNDAVAYNNRGIAYDNKGDFDQAIQDYNISIKLKPDFAEVYHHRGVAYGEKGDFEQAMQDYNKAIDLKPDFADAYFNRGDAYSDKGEFDQAIQDYSKAIDLKPDPEAYYNRGIDYDNKGDFDQAIQDFDKAIELEPDYADAYINRGNAYSDKGEFDQAIQDYNKAVELNPNDAEAYNNRGNAYSDKDDFDQAIQDFDKAIDLKPDFAEAYFNRGIVGLILGEWEKAKADLTTAKNTSMDIADFFPAVHKSVADFEREYDLELPEDIAAMLTGETV